MRSWKEIQDILSKEFETKEITKEAIDQIFKYPKLFRGSVKTSLGRLYTTDEYNARRNRILKMKLP